MSIDKAILAVAGLGLLYVAYTSAAVIMMAVPENAPSDPTGGSPVTPPDVTGNANRAAFLAMLRHSEGTDQYADPYLTIFGGAQSPYGYADHPGNLGYTAWVYFTANGVRTYSTASGAYQFRLATWNGLKNSMGLPDFSPASQDAAAIQLISNAGALDAVDAGDIATACQRLNRIWASLPGSPYGQAGGQSLASLESAFQGYLATVA